MKKLVVLSGAGISAESGLNTFRNAGGLWEGHSVHEVATPEAFAQNPDLVNAFYNARRAQLLQCKPNRAHERLAELEAFYEVQIITQNVDDLHERAGSSHILHLHGELLKVRSVANPSYILDWHEDITADDTDPQGNALRPHIVWFGEAVPQMTEALGWVKEADVLIVIGTSLSVYPAAGLLYEAPSEIPVYYIDPNPAPIHQSGLQLQVLPTSAVHGMEQLFETLKIS